MFSSPFAHMMQIEGMQKPLRASLSSVGNFARLNPQKTKEFEGGMKEHQMSLPQSET